MQWFYCLVHPWFIDSTAYIRPITDSISAYTWEKGTESIFGLAKNTISTPFSLRCNWRHISLIRRFAPLRHTAFPFFFPATKATRPPEDSVRPRSFDETISVTLGVWIRLPREKRFEISVLDLIISNANPLFTRKDAYGPWRDEQPAQHDHPW